MPNLSATRSSSGNAPIPLFPPRKPTDSAAPRHAGPALAWPDHGALTIDNLQIDRVVAMVSAATRWSGWRPDCLEAFGRVLQEELGERPVLGGRVRRGAWRKRISEAVCVTIYGGDRGPAPTMRIELNGILLLRADLEAGRLYREGPEPTARRDRNYVDPRRTDLSASELSDRSIVLTANAMSGLASMFQRALDAGYAAAGMPGVRVAVCVHTIEAVVDLPVRGAHALVDHLERRWVVRTGGTRDANSQGPRLVSRDTGCRLTIYCKGPDGTLLRCQVTLWTRRGRKCIGRYGLEDLTSERLRSDLSRQVACHVATLTKVLGKPCESPFAESSEALVEALAKVAPTRDLDAARRVIRGLLAHGHSKPLADGSRDAPLCRRLAELGLARRVGNARRSRWVPAGALEAVATDWIARRDRCAPHPAASRDGDQS